jgi:hypothetical protein
MRDLLKFWYAEYMQFSTVAILSSDMFECAKAGNQDQPSLKDSQIEILRDVVSLLPKQGLSSNSLIVALKQTLDSQTRPKCNIVPPALLNQFAESWDPVVLASIAAYFEIPSGNENNPNHSNMLLLPFCQNRFWKLAVADLTPRSCHCLTYEPGSKHLAYSCSFEMLLRKLFGMIFKQAGGGFHLSFRQTSLDGRQTRAKYYHTGILVVEGARKAIAHGSEMLLKFGKGAWINYAAARIQYAETVLRSNGIPVHDLAHLYDGYVQYLYGPSNLDDTCSTHDIENFCLAIDMKDIHEESTDGGSVYDSSEDSDDEDDQHCRKRSYISKRQIPSEMASSNELSQVAFSSEWLNEDTTELEYETDVDLGFDVRTWFEEDPLHDSYSHMDLDVSKEDWSDEDRLSVISSDDAEDLPWVDDTELAKKDDPVFVQHYRSAELDSDVSNTLLSHQLDTQGPCFLPFTKEMSRKAFTLLGPQRTSQSRPGKSP